MFPALVTAFSTSSSSATLPVTIRNAQENLGVSKRIDYMRTTAGGFIYYSNRGRAWEEDGLYLFGERELAGISYADGLDLTRASAFEPIGISCRICERKECHQRSVPPLERKLTVTPDMRGLLPYQVG